MNAKFTSLMLIVFTLFTTLSCSSDGSDEPVVPPLVIPAYNYNAFELETITLLNNYRVSKGLVALKKSDYISYQAESHNLYMITNNTVKHDNFSIRAASIVKVLGATVVGENLAFNIDTAQEVVNDWIASSEHKANIEGDFTHFGLSVRVNADGKKYYTNIFAKI